MQRVVHMTNVWWVLFAIWVHSKFCVKYMMRGAHCVVCPVITSLVPEVSLLRSDFAA